MGVCLSEESSEFPVCGVICGVLWRETSLRSTMPRKPISFRVGHVQGYLRGQVWYLCYHEHGQRRRPRVGPNKETARQLAAQINGQLEIGAPAVLSFEPISIRDLREQWLQQHEQVLRSSLHTVARYRTATEHLLRYLEQNAVGRCASHFGVSHAEAFVRYLRSLVVAPNGHPHTAKRHLMDKLFRKWCRPFSACRQWRRP